MKNSSLPFGRLLKVACLFPLLATAALAQTPIIEYKFNNTGTAVVDTGSSGTITNFYKSGLADLHSEDALGVSGQVGDRAFLNTRTGSGPTLTGGGAYTGSSVVSAIDGLQSFTLMGWFNTGDSSMIASGARLLAFDSASGGIALWADGNGKLTLTVNGGAATSSQALYSATNSWQFFAITYDGTLTSSNVSFYVGSVGENSLSSPLIQSFNKGAVVGSDRGLMVGNRGGYDRPYGGYLDNIRIFGSKTDASGALSATEIEAFRAQDVIPEPSSVALVVLAGAGLLCRGKKWL